MIRGSVNARREAVVQVRVRGPGGDAADVDAVVDTGFSNAMTLSGATIASLGLNHQSATEALLADGSLRTFDAYNAEIEWDGAWRQVLMWEIGDANLIGVALLAGYELRMAVTPGGAVEITALP